jgi:hypothetical protein
MRNYNWRERYRMRVAKVKNLRAIVYEYDFFDVKMKDNVGAFFFDIFSPFVHCSYQGY